MPHFAWDRFFLNAKIIHNILCRINFPERSHKIRFYLRNDLTKSYNGVKKMTGKVANKVCWWMIFTVVNCSSISLEIYGCHNGLRTAVLPEKNKTKQNTALLNYQHIPVNSTITSPAGLPTIYKDWACINAYNCTVKTFRMHSMVGIEANTLGILGTLNDSG